MNKLKLLIVSISLILASGIASAASISANATLQSDYTWRGMTQNLGDGSVNGGLDIEFDSGFYVGSWAASVGSGSEVDYYAGYAGSAGDIGYDIGYIKFDYPAAAGGTSDFEELYIGVDLPLGIGISYASGEKAFDETPSDGFGISDNIEVSYGFDLGEGSVGLSYGEYEDIGDYFYITYGFDFMDFAITLGYTEFSDDSTTAHMTDDEDAFFIDIGIL